MSPSERRLIKYGSEEPTNYSSRIIKNTTISKEPYQIGPGLYQKYYKKSK